MLYEVITLRGAGGDVARSQVTERRIFAFEIVVTVFFGNLTGRFFAVFLTFGNPATSYNFV